MPAKRFREESGYSLIEVMVSIVIFTLAILPMISMFDMGITTAGTGSNYDKARTLANMKLEQAKGLSFANVEGNFPEAGDATPYDEPATWLPGVDEDADFTGFEYRVVKQYIAQPPTDPDSASEDFDTCPPSDPLVAPPCEPPTDLIRVTVIVQWGDGNSYTTYGLVAQ